MKEDWIIEYWLPVKDNPKYEVSNLGNVRNSKTKYVLSQETTYRGYKRVGLSGKHRYVHRLVADAFFDRKHDRRDVNHIDGDKTNNFLSNLEWCSRSKNIKHAFETGLKYPSRTKVVHCGLCKNRYNYDICEDKEDDFFCGYGEHK